VASLANRQLCSRGNALLHHGDAWRHTPRNCGVRHLSFLNSSTHVFCTLKVAHILVFSGQPVLGSMPNTSTYQPSLRATYKTRPHGWHHTAYNTFQLYHIAQYMKYSLLRNTICTATPNQISNTKGMFPSKLPAMAPRNFPTLRKLDYPATQPPR
jgi:hypothetical protein